MIADAHNHVWEGSGYLGAGQTAEDLLRRMDAAGVDMCLIFTRPEQPDNDYVAAAVRAQPDRLVGLGCVNPWQKDAQGELWRCLGELDLKGLKLHPTLHAFPLDRHALADPLFEMCREAGVPVLVHGMAQPYCWPSRFEEMARTFPDVPIIMAHSGFMMAVDEAVRAAERNRNLYLETSCLDSTDVAFLMQELPAEKIVMGSDTPWARFEVERLKLELAIPDQRVRDLVMGENLLTLLSRST